MDSFDATDLRLRVRSAFTTAELRRLLVGLGEPEDALVGSGPAELAHRLVRVGAKQIGPRELIVRLRAEKPLFEWPVLDDHDERWAGPMSLRLESPVAETGPEPADTLVMQAPRSDDPSEPDAPPSTVVRVTEDRVGPTSEPRVEDRPEPPPPQPIRFVTEGPPPPRAPRWLVIAAVAGLVVGLGGVAFGVGAWMGRSREAPSAPGASRAPHSKTAAGRATTLLEGALTAVGRVCDVEVEGALTVEILELSLEACGRDEVDKLRRQRERDVLDDRLDDPRPRAPGTTPTSTAARPRGGATTDRPSAANAVPARPSCRQGCATGRSACQAECGKEPSDAARYGPFQSCISHCVADESRCRLGCR